MRTGRRWLAVLSLLMGTLAACDSVGAPLPAGGPSAETQPPTIVIDQPPSGTSVEAGTQVLIQSTSSDSAGIVRVDLQVDGVTVRSDAPPDGVPLPQFSLLQGWLPEQAGSYTVQVIAYRDGEIASTPASVTVNVTGAAAAPPGQAGTAATPGQQQAGAAQPPAAAAGQGGVGQPPAAGSPGPPSCMVTVSTALSARSGPGPEYDAVEPLAMGQQLPATGRTVDSSWYRINYGAGEGWIPATYAYLSAACPPLPVGEAAGPEGSPTGEVTATLSGPTLTPTATYTPGGPTLTPTLTPTFTPTTNPLTPTFTPTLTPSGVPPTPTFTPTYTPTTAPATHTYTPSYTPTTAPPPQAAPADANYALAVPLDSTASVTDFVSYPAGDREDRVSYTIDGMNSNPSLPGGQARLIIAVSCFGTGTQHITLSTGGQTFSCGQTIVDREVTFDSRTGSVLITAVGGEGTYVQWVVTGTATRTN